MNCEYARKYYDVPAEIGRRVDYKGQSGIIAEDRGHYIGVNFDDQKVSLVHNVHPTEEGLKYLEMGRVRPLTRSQRNYQQFLRAECNETFSEWMGFGRSV